MRTYGQQSFAARVQLLRSLANYTETPTPNVLFYARSDTQRRQLLSPRGHLAAVQAMYQPRFEVVSWDDVWSGGSTGQRPSVDEQIHLLRNRSGLAHCPLPNAQCPMPKYARSSYLTAGGGVRGAHSHGGEALRLS